MSFINFSKKGAGMGEGIQNSPIKMEGLVRGFKKGVSRILTNLFLKLSFSVCGIPIAHLYHFYHYSLGFTGKN